MSTNAPAKCPECGRISIDNRRHCKPKDEPGAVAFWSKHCLTYVCICGTTYASHGHYRSEVRPS